MKAEDLSPVHLFFLLNAKKKKNTDTVIRNIWLDLILYLFAKNIYVVKNINSEIINSELVFLLDNIF